MRIIYFTDAVESYWADGGCLYACFDGAIYNQKKQVNLDFYCKDIALVYKLHGRKLLLKSMLDQQSTKVLGNPPIFNRS